MARAFGIDISKFQSSPDGSKKMDFDVVRAHSEEVTFIAARAGVSWAYQDPMFDYYWGEMARIGVCRLAYFVVYFGESALSQMDAFFKTLEGKSDWNHDRLVLDLEVAGINPRERITATTLRCLDICRERTGRYPLIYSRAEWINNNLKLGSLPALDYWLATYKPTAPYPFYTAEHAGPPLLPRGVSTYLIHQTGDKCKSIGGVSRSMDYDRWNGDKNAVLSYFNYPGGVVSAPPQVLFKAKCLVSALYKRNGPGATFSVIGALSLGDVVNVYEEKDGWLRLDPSAQVWCSGAANYVQRFEANAASEPALFKAQVIVRALYKRSGPSSTSPVVGNLVNGEVVQVYEVEHGWYRIASYDQVWCSGASQYVKRV